MSQPTDDDHDLNAFLVGEDDLSARLRGLPQPAPSAELDQAILAQAALLAAQQRNAQGQPGKQQLGDGHAATAPVRLAANDALPGAANDAVHDQSALPAGSVVPPAPAAIPSSRRPRWLGPLALAASVLLVAAVSLQLLHLRRDIPAATELAQAPAAVAPAAAPPVVIARLEPPAEPAAKAELADKNAAAFARPAAKPVPQLDAAKAVARKDEADLAAARSGRQQLALNDAAQATAAVSGTARKEAAAAAAEERVAVASVAPESAADAAKSKADQIGLLAEAEVDAVKPRQARSATSGGQGQRESKGADSQLDFYSSKPIVAAAPPAPAAPAAAKAAPAAEQRKAVVAAVAPQAEAGAAAPTVQAAADWLAQIVVLEKTGNKRQAGMEWRRFHQAHPDYPVDEALRKRLDALAP